MTLPFIRNPLAWPNGARCAVCISFDMDAESLVHRRFPDTAPEQVSLAAQLRYGPQVAVPRFLDIFRHFGIKQTFFIPGWCIDRYPETIEAILKDGHEIGHHGYRHNWPNKQSPDEELRSLYAGIEAIERVTGKRPAGYRAPAFQQSSRTVKTLLDEGFLYDASLFGNDIPYLIGDGSRSLLELPTDLSLDDWTQYACMPDFGYMMQVASPQSAMQVVRAEFDAAWQHGGMISTVWHPFLSGRLARAQAIFDLLEYMVAKGDVWFAPMHEIAAYARSKIDAGEWTPREDVMPFNPAPLSPDVPG